MSSAIQRKLHQETELLEPETSNAIEDSDPSDSFEEHQEINIVVNENGDILKLDRATCDWGRLSPVEADISGNRDYLD